MKLEELKRLVVMKDGNVFLRGTNCGRNQFHFSYLGNKVPTKKSRHLRVDNIDIEATEAIQQAVASLLPIEIVLDKNKKYNIVYK